MILIFNLSQHLRLWSILDLVLLELSSMIQNNPLKIISNLELQNHGYWSGLINQAPYGKPYLLKFVWIEWDRRYSIALEYSLQEGQCYIQIFWRKIDSATNEDTEMIDMAMLKLKMDQYYHNKFAYVDQHNRHRQDTLRIKHWNQGMKKKGEHESLKYICCI